jgi:hypothetical protein
MDAVMNDLSEHVDDLKKIVRDGEAFYEINVRLTEIDRILRNLGLECLDDWCKMVEMRLDVLENK